ncbi:MAG TPA: TonB-dependent receptor [Gemmatimonadaceae bacterium]|nr:TonB-dependent receptor [Gemmatimonadaceae bacterium]
MRIPRWMLRASVVFGLAAGLPAVLAAQGVTTGAIGGTVTDPQGQPVEGAQVQVINRSTGFSSGSLTRSNGSYLVQGLEVGSAYTVRIRRIGFEPVERTDVRVSLSQTTRVDVQLSQQAVQLGAVQVTAGPAELSATNQGTKTTVSDTAIQRLPSLNRNLTEFIRLTPQVSSSGPGFSGGGMSNRMNNVQIDGATERDVFGLGSTGQPGGQVSAKAISIDAVKEFQVLLAPFDVRQGNFGGLLLNAVTKSGTNTFTGSAYGFYRNESFGANVPAIRSTNFLRQQLGFSIGGPIITDKLHFFTANEFTKEDEPVTGPYFGQAASITPAFPIAAADLQRFEQILQQRYAFPSHGTAGVASSPQPGTNLFGRLDYQASAQHRFVFRYNFTNTTKENRRQDGRSSSRAVYSSNFHNIEHTKHAPVLQLFSNFSNGWSNEAFLGANWVQDRRTPNGGIFPQIAVNLGSNTIQAGADQFSQGNELDAYTYEFTNNLTIPRGNHTFVVGTRNELNFTRNLFAQSSYGVWTFRGLDSLEAGNPTTFRRALILQDEGNAYFDALQSALYVQDQWRATPNFNLTFGLRADINRFLRDNDFHPAIDSAYGARETPKGSLQWSPRVGFNWDVTGDQVNQLRGGVGLFVGTPPYVWLENAYINNGRIITFLNCNTTATPAPAYAAPGSMPEVCRNGAGARPIGAVNFLDADIKFPQPLRANLGVDRLLPWNLVATLEGLYSRSLNQFFFVNRNLAGPQGTDARGRVLYGTIGTNGRSTATLPAAVIANGGSARFNEAFDIVNQNKDYAYNLTAQLKKRYANNWEAQLAYTFSRARDVQSFTSSTHVSNWRFGRTLAGNQEEIYTTRSLFETPHRVVGFATYTLEWMRGLATDLTLSYSGQSGAPHDYIYNGSSGTGDLNADGSQGNDLLYVPTSATDPTQIQFRTANFTDPSGQRVSVTAAQQAQAFEQFIASSECLSKFRGRIMERNACTQPWFNQFDLQIRQSLPTIRGQRVALTFDIFNFGNMLNGDWGKQQNTPASLNSNVPLVFHGASTTADARTAVPIVEFNPFTYFRNWSATNPGTPEEYQASEAFTGNFWRIQLGLRYSF